MRYQITQHGFPVGDKLIPVGTVIDSKANDDWSRLAKGRAPPINALALDQEAWDAIQAAHPYQQHLIPRPVRR